MFTVKIVKNPSNEDVYLAARYKRRNNIIELYAPRNGVDYVLSGQVNHKTIDLDNPEIQNVFIMNSFGKTVDRYGS